MAVPVTPHHHALVSGYSPRTPLALVASQGLSSRTVSDWFCSCPSPLPARQGWAPGSLWSWMPGARRRCAPYGVCQRRSQGGGRTGNRVGEPCGFQRHRQWPRRHEVTLNAHVPEDSTARPVFGLVMLPGIVASARSSPDCTQAGAAEKTPGPLLAVGSSAGRAGDRASGQDKIASQ